MERVAAIVAAVLLVVMLAAPLQAVNPDIGGTAVYTEQDYFSANGWGVTAYSYVYDSTGGAAPEIYPGFALNAGEMLFVYLLDYDDSESVSVDHFAVGNPELAAISTVGWSVDVAATGYNVSNHQEPYLSGYSGPAQAVIFTYTGNFMDPWSTLDPGEYSLVYYVAGCDNYGFVGATADGAGTCENQLVPGPSVPEPTTICLFSLGLAALFCKRKP